MQRLRISCPLPKWHGELLSDLIDDPIPQPCLRYNAIYIGTSYGSRNEDVLTIIERTCEYGNKLMPQVLRDILAGDHIDGDGRAWP